MLAPAVASGAEGPIHSTRSLEQRCLVDLIVNLVWRHPLVVIAAVLAAVALVVVLLLAGLGGGDSDGARATPTATPSPTPSAVDGVDAETDEASTGMGTGGSPDGATSSFGGGPGGLAGEGASLSTTTRRLTMSATSDEPIFVLGYQAPTSNDAAYGRVESPGRSWSRSTTVYGPPDYAQIFLQAGPRATTITCTVTVDGRVTDRRTATGPYAQLFCQG